MPQGEELSTGVRDAGNPGDDGNPQTLVTERPPRHGREISFLLHQVLVPVCRDGIAFEGRAGVEVWRFD